ncbi:unnamed protein product [Brugia timori]|uniref:ShKT domain-containing protein n=1 Tax=Brugia timori TaxID=42155 RepID=A0A0R3QFJ5_9BILA|nr:unnamed protein product [Brugia timori]
MNCKFNFQACNGFQRITPDNNSFDCNVVAGHAHPCVDLLKEVWRTTRCMSNCSVHSTR